MKPSLTPLMDILQYTSKLTRLRTNCFVIVYYLMKDDVIHAWLAN